MKMPLDRRTLLKRSGRVRKWLTGAAVVVVPPLFTFVNTAVLNHRDVVRSLRGPTDLSILIGNTN